MTIGDLNQTKVTAVNPPTGADAAKSIQNSKLKDAAEQFEAIFMQEMLKPLQSTSSDGMGGEDKDAPAGSDTLSSFGTEAVAKAIAKGGGLGIARQIVQKVSLERLQHQNAAG
jgi:Rod binding domain-containing protein